MGDRHHPNHNYWDNLVRCIRVRLTKMQACDFLSFDTLDLEVGQGLTVVTGPNGIGKT